MIRGDADHTASYMKHYQMVHCMTMMTIPTNSHCKISTNKRKMIMGYYINTGSSKGKSEYMVDNHGARVISLTEARSLMKSESPDESVLCCIDNGPFEALGYCFDVRELEDFAYPDGRRKTWLKAPTDIVHKLTQYA